VYSYGSGKLISKALQHKVRQDPSFIKKYIDMFLSAGTSESPTETFQKMGINIHQADFRQSAIDEMRSMLDEIKGMIKQ